MIFHVSSQEATLSLLKFIKTKIPEGTSVKTIKRAIEARSCKVGGKIERFSSRRLSVGDIVEFTLNEYQNLPASLKYLYEDEDILAIDKPAGMVATLPHLQKFLRRREIHLVHRLDKETTGVFLFAKNQEAK